MVVRMGIDLSSTMVRSDPRNVFAYVSDVTSFTSEPSIIDLIGIKVIRRYTSGPSRFGIRPYGPLVILVDSSLPASAQVVPIDASGSSVGAT